MISVLALTAWMATAGATPVLTLEQALEQARQNNLDLRIARERLSQAELASRRAWAGYLPTVVASGAYIRNSDEARVGLPGGPEIVIQPFNQFTGQLELRQALIAPQLWAGIKASYSAEQLALLNTEQAKREILFGVAQAYYGAAAAQAAVMAQERLLEVNQARVKDTQARYDAGTVTRVALLSAQLDLTRAEQDLLRQRNSLAAAKLALATLLVREDSDFELAPPPEPSLPPEETDLVNLALEQRADVAASRENVNLANINKTGAWLAYLPTLGVNAAYRANNAAGFTGQSTTWAITVAASWTIWDGGLREVNLREQSSRVRESTALREQSELRTREEVRRSQLDLETALGNRARAAQALELAREQQRLTEISFKAGVATYLEVTNANAALTGAEVGFISERLNAALSALRLLRSVGAFGREPLIAEVTKAPLPELTRQLLPAEQSSQPPPTPAQQQQQP